MSGALRQANLCGPPCAAGYLLALQVAELYAQADSVDGQGSGF